MDNNETSVLSRPAERHPFSSPRQRLIGCVDHVDDVAITGWVANADRPDLTETVVLQDQSGRTTEFQAWHVREDVCQSLGVHGRFGFVVPLSALNGFGTVLTVRDRQGLTLENGSAVHIPPIVAPARPAETIIFLHIPKTAGSSVRNSIIGGLSPSDRLFLYPPPFGLTIEEFEALPPAQLQAAHAVIGHAYYGVHRALGQRARYATFLRNPLARLRSHAAHHARACTGFRHDGMPVPLSTVVSEGLDEEFDNLLVRSVAGLPSSIRPLGKVGEADVDLAMLNIERHFAMIGFVETIESDAARLASLLGRPVSPVAMDNVAAPRSCFEQTEHGIDWERVKQRNRFDQMFYDRVWQSAPSPVHKAAHARRGYSDQGLFEFGTDAFGHPAPPA